MRIHKYCGAERLTGSEQLWRRLARRADFSGHLFVYGYGVKGIGGIEQRQYERGARNNATTGDYDSELNRIRVWLKCRCQAAIDDPELEFNESPLDVFVHELGHHLQHQQGVLLDEAGATARGKRLLADVRSLA